MRTRKTEKQKLEEIITTRHYDNKDFEINYEMVLDFLSRLGIDLDCNSLLNLEENQFIDIVEIVYCEEFDNYLYDRFIQEREHY